MQSQMTSLKSHAMFSESEKKLKIHLEKCNEDILIKKDKTFQCDKKAIKKDKT